MQAKGETRWKLGKDSHSLTILCSALCLGTPVRASARQYYIIFDFDLAGRKRHLFR